MITKVTERPGSTKNKIILEWEGDIGFGTLDIRYMHNGHYDIDAEYLSFDTVAEIIKVWKS